MIVFVAGCLRFGKLLGSGVQGMVSLYFGFSLGFRVWFGAWVSGLLSKSKVLEYGFVAVGFMDCFGGVVEQTTGGRFRRAWPV